MQFRCPNPECRQVLKVKDELAGKRGRCPKCGTTITVPSATAPEPPRHPAPATMPRPAPSPAPAQAEWQPDQVIEGLYEVKRELGRGGMGVLWLVHHRNWNTDLAVKCPTLDFLSKAGGAGTVAREAETWVNLPLHPHLVQAHYVKEIDGIPRIFVEYADGGSLRHWLKQGKVDSLERGLDAAIQIAWGMKQAHEAGWAQQ